MHFYSFITTISALKIACHCERSGRTPVIRLPPAAGNNRGRQVSQLRAKPFHTWREATQFEPKPPSGHCCSTMQRLDISFRVLVLRREFHQLSKISAFIHTVSVAVNGTRDHDVAETEPFYLLSTPTSEVTVFWVFICDADDGKIDVNLNKRVFFGGSWVKDML